MRRAEEILDQIRSTLPGSMVPWKEALAAVEQAQREAIEEAAGVSDYIAHIGRASPFWDDNSVQMFVDCSERIRALLPHREGQ